MPAGFFTFNDAESDGMLDMVNDFHGDPAKPEAYEIRTGSEKDFAQEELGHALFGRRSG